MDRLVCLESSKVNRAFEDPVLLDDSRVLKNMMDTEDKYIPRDYFSGHVQKDIQPFMRKMVSEWMAEVCQELNAEEEVFPLSMNYMDRFLCIVNLPRTQLQCLGSACMLLASKLKENLHMAAEQLVTYTDHSITNSDLTSMESFVLRHLKWDLSAITPNDFVAHIVHRLPLDPAHVSDVKKHAQSFIGLVISDSKFISCPPSMIAMCCIAATIRGMNIKVPNVTELLHRITSIDLELLRACQENVEEVIQSHLKQFLREQTREETGEGPLAPAETSLLSKYPQVEQSTTPTDVRDINLMAVDEENSYFLG